MNFILYSFRRYHQLTQKDVATGLQLSLEEYADIESAISNTDTELAQKFSAFYKAPKHIFLLEQNSATLQVVFNHNHFENSNGFVQHLYPANTTAEQMAQEQGKFIQILVTEIERMKKLCTKLQLDVNKTVKINPIAK